MMNSTIATSVKCSYTSQHPIVNLGKLCGHYVQYLHPSISYSNAHFSLAHFQPIHIFLTKDQSPFESAWYPLARTKGLKVLLNIWSPLRLLFYFLPSEVIKFVTSSSLTRTVSHNQNHYGVSLSK
jgi:hypothetical protein